MIMPGKQTNTQTYRVTEPETEQAQALEGAYAGFQPKPAVEVILVVMKPLAEKSYTEQALANGKGCTWLDNCRIPYATENIPSRDLVKQKSSAGGQVPASTVIVGMVIPRAVSRQIFLSVMMFWMTGKIIRVAVLAVEQSMVEAEGYRF